MGGPKGNTTQRRCHVLGVGLADPRAELLVQLLLQPFPTLPASSWGPRAWRRPPCGRTARMLAPLQPWPPLISFGVCFRKEALPVSL